MVRSSGQIPNELDTGHTHLKSSIIDDETREPAEFSAPETIVSVLQASVTLTDAQIKALPTTPVQIIPAPGAGKIIIPLMSYSILDAIAGVYTNLDGASAYGLPFLDGGAPHSEAFVGHSGNFLEDNDANRPKITLLPYAPSAPDGSYEYGYSENKAIGVRLFNGALGNLTGGNAANTLVVTVLYGVMDV